MNGDLVDNMIESPNKSVLSFVQHYNKTPEVSALLKQKGVGSLLSHFAAFTKKRQLGKELLKKGSKESVSRDDS